MSVTVTQLHRFAHAHHSDVNSVAFLGSGDNLVLASASGDKTVRLWDTHTKQELPISPLLGHTYYVNCVKFSPFGSMLASCSTDGKAILWDSKTGEKLQIVEHASCGGLRICTFSPNSTLLVTGSDDETLVIWNIADRRQIRQLEGHEGAITAVTISPDSTYIVSGSTNGDLRLWDARYGHGKSLVCIPEAHDLGVMCCDFSLTAGAETSPDTVTGSSGSGSSTSVGTFYLATCGNDKMVKLWLVHTRPPRQGPQIVIRYELSGHAGHVMSVQFSPDGQLLASGGGDHSVCIWNPNTGELLCKVSEHTRYVACVAFSSDGRHLASGSNDRSLILWQITSHSQDQMRAQEAVRESLTDRPSVPEYIRQQSKLIGEWTTGEVCTWLVQLGLPQYVESFQRHDMDGRELMSLTHDVCIRQLGIDALGHRNKMLRSIRQLQDNPYDLQGAASSDHNVPGEYLCPITHDLMTDPVIAADGYSYERSAIAAWLSSGKLSSPMTNERLASGELTPNRMLRMLIHKHCNNTDNTDNTNTNTATASE